MDKNKGIIIGVLVLLVGAVVAMRWNEQPKEAPPEPEAQPTAAAPAPELNNKTAAKTPDATKLQKIDLRVGKGKVAKTGDHVVMQYRGTLTDGTVFDESYKRGQPFDFTIGGGQVIKGWDEGIPGMKEGGKRKLIIPPDMGYGAGGQGPIPPNATLIFEVELVKVG